MKKVLLAAFLVAMSAASTLADEFRPIKTHAFPFDSVSRAVTDPNGFQGGYNVGAGVSVLRLVCTTACFVAFSATDVTPSVSATASTSMYIPANVPEYFRISPRNRIAVIRSTSDGWLYIGEMSK